MSSVDGYVPLTEDLGTLKKSCICKTGNKRCTRKRFHDGNDETYQDLLDNVTTYWPQLDARSRSDAAGRFFEYSVCTAHLKDDRHHALKARFLAENVQREPGTPSRSARGDPAVTEGTTRQSKTVPEDARSLRQHPFDEDTATDGEDDDRTMIVEEAHYHSAAATCESFLIQLSVA